MGIGSINDYAGILQNYRVPVIREVSLDAVRSQEEKNTVTAAPAVELSHEIPSVSYPERKDAPLEDISITFNKEDDFGYIGRDKDIRSLDVEKAIDDMRKDQILQQYQYFVGSSRNIVSESEDGTVIQKMM